MKKLFGIPSPIMEDNIKIGFKEIGCKRVDSFCPMDLVSQQIKAAKLNTF